MSAEPPIAAGQVRVRLLADSQLLEPDADRGRLSGLARVAARYAGVQDAAIEVELADGEWHTLASAQSGPPAPGATVRDVAGLRTADGVEFGRLRLYDHDEVLIDQVIAQPRTITDLGALAEAVAAIVEAEAGATRVFEAVEEVARAEAELSRVAGQISHDLNNPLAAVAMSLEIATDQADQLPPVVVSLLERATSSATRMKRMTSDLLTYAQVPSRGDADVLHELEQVMEGLEESLRGELRAHEPLPRVAMSPADLRVVLLALLENAVKFSDPEQPVQIDVAATRLAEGPWRITVADRGRGIPEADRERVLAPMVRLDKRVPGLGLGLATVRRIVEAAGGEVAVEARGGGGTVVGFTVPDAS